MMEIKIPIGVRADADGAKICGMDVGSTTCKYVLCLGHPAKSFPRPTNGTTPNKRKKFWISWRGWKRNSAFTPEHGPHVLYRLGSGT